MGFVFKAAKKLVGGLFGVDTPKPQPMELPKQVDTAAAAAAADAERRRGRLASGRAATMLSNQSSYTDPTVGRKMLG